MFTIFNTDIYSVAEILGTRDEMKPFQKNLRKSDYTLQQAKIYAIKNDYPIIVEPQNGDNWYLKGYGCNRTNLQNAINTRLEQKYRLKSKLYFINE
jgi:hypothetical protein